MTPPTATLSAIIVDDEQLARLAIRELLSTHPEIAVVAECANGIEAVKAVSELQPSLVFLDVQMPKLTGFDVLELIETDAAVIFTTAFDHYAVRAFEVNSLDYLLKPVPRDRLVQAVGRAQQRERRAPPRQLAGMALGERGPLRRAALTTLGRESNCCDCRRSS